MFFLHIFFEFLEYTPIFPIFKRTNFRLHSFALLLIKTILEFAVGVEVDCVESSQKFLSFLFCKFLIHLNYNINHSALIHGII